MDDESARKSILGDDVIASGTQARRTSSGRGRDGRESRVRTAEHMRAANTIDRTTRLRPHRSQPYDREKWCTSALDRSLWARRVTLRIRNLRNCPLSVEPNPQLVDLTTINVIRSQVAVLKTRMLIVAFVFEYVSVSNVRTLIGLVFAAIRSWRGVL